MFSCEFCETSEHLFTEHLWATASVFISLIINSIIIVCFRKRWSDGIIHLILRLRSIKRLRKREAKICKQRRRGFNKHYKVHHFKFLNS